MSHSCGWCGKDTDKLFTVFAAGEGYEICADCNKAHVNGVCRICNTANDLFLYKGVCTSCSQDELARRFREEEELNEGVALELLEAYSNGVQFTEEDFKHWMTFGQGTFSPAYLKQIRRNWLINKLCIQGNWDRDLVERSMGDIEVIMERHSVKIMTGTYVLIYFNAADDKTRRLCVDQYNNIMLVEKSAIDKYSKLKRRRRK